ncbi:MAG TPA: hypothetical protein VKB95_01855 [Chitinophagaceae bacterium]|nr:hypothetical protein [Chitinophagaceae bacterium]
MRIYFIAILLLFDVIFSEAQISTEEIKKYNIHKITEKSFVGDSLTEMTSSYFDKQGNIYKETSGSLTKNITNTYENDRLKKVINYAYNGKEEQTTEYFYSSDSSYMTISTEKNFGAKNYSWHKPNGDIIKGTGVDTFFYKYDDQGKLIYIVSGGNDQERKMDVIYSYNTKGQLTKVEAQQTNNFQTTENYEYDLKGKQVKAINKTMAFGNTRISVTSYEYNEKGLLTKEITTESEDGAKTKTTINIYEYEFYEN